MAFNWVSDPMVKLVAFIKHLLRTSLYIKQLTCLSYLILKRYLLNRKLRPREVVWLAQAYTVCVTDLVLTFRSLILSPVLFSIMTRLPPSEEMGVEMSNTQRQWFLPLFFIVCVLMVMCSSRAKLERKYLYLFIHLI